MSNLTNEERCKQLVAWMGEYDITFTAIGEQLGLTGAGASRVCQSETCPPCHHQKLLELGFPSELLPVPKYNGAGRKKRPPRFPGLVHAQQAQTGEATHF